MKWKMRDGWYINVKDMESSHINNCIKLLKKQIKQLNSLTTLFPVFQGDMAQYYAEQDFDRIENEKALNIANNNEWINVFKKELENRKSN